LEAVADTARSSRSAAPELQGVQTLTLSLLTLPATGTLSERISPGIRWSAAGQHTQNTCAAGASSGVEFNCEYVPLLPACAVERMLSDPRKIQYLLVWISREDGTVQEALRIRQHNEVENLGGLDGRRCPTGRAGPPSEWVRNAPPVAGRGGFVSFPGRHGATCWKKTSGCACVSPDIGLCGLVGSVTWFRLSPQTA
jgi:hypothetical protein